MSLFSSYRAYLSFYIKGTDINLRTIYFEIERRDSIFLALNRKDRSVHIYYVCKMLNMMTLRYSIENKRCP